MAIDPAFQTWAQSLQLDVKHTTALWRALRHSRLPQVRPFLLAVVQLCGSGISEDQRRLHLRHFLDGLGSPQALCRLLEALVAEKRLTWRQGNPIIENILTRTNDIGHWK